MQLTSHLCKLCGSRRDSPSPLIVCLGCANVVSEVDRGEDGICRCPDCQERVCGLSFAVAQKAYAKIVAGKQALHLLNRAIADAASACQSGG